jgi:hypothetical protein
MKRSTINILESNVRNLSYADIARALAKETSDELLRLLDCRSVKIGDSAADLLGQKRAAPLIAAAVLQKAIKTKIGKIRACNILSSFGRRYPEAKSAYVALLSDANADVVSNALLGLVLWGDKQMIPLIEELQKSAKSEEAANHFNRAREALEKSNPNIFAPYLIDAMGIW